MINYNLIDVAILIDNIRAKLTDIAPSLSEYQQAQLTEADEQLRSAKSKVIFASSTEE